MERIGTTTPVDLTGLTDLSSETAPDRFQRVGVAQAPGLQVFHLALFPGQTVPRHGHPDRHVLLHGLAGVVRVEFGGETVDLHAGHLLHLPDEREVLLYNDGGAPCSLLITLAKRHEEMP